MTGQIGTNPEPRGQDLLASLRSGTREHHRHLDSHPALATLLQQPSPEQYRHSLTALARGWLPLEEALEIRIQASPWRRHFLARRRALTEDLAQLNVTVPAQPGNPPDLSGDRAVGVLYTLTGAQLGSAMLERSLSLHNPTLPMTFFRTRSNGWPAFCRDLGQYDGTEETATAMVEGARAAFDYLLAGLTVSES